MAGVVCYLNELDNQRDKLANILASYGIEADESEKFNTLIDKVPSIASSEISTTGIFKYNFIGSTDSVSGIMETEG